MKTRFELIGRTKATVEAITILSEKLGQKDVKPAVCISFKTPRPNSALDMFDKTLRPFLYSKAATASSIKQAQLDGVEVVSDMPNLTDAASRIGTINWEYEQTGCTLRVYHGATGRADIKLKDGTVKKVQLECNEGGTVDVYWQFYTANVDAETIGELGILKSLERDIELTAPEIISSKQKDLAEQPGGTVTPIDALKKAEKEAGEQGKDEGKSDAAWPFPNSAHADNKKAGAGARK